MPSPTISLLFFQEIFQELQSGLTQIPMEPLLFPGTRAHESLCAPFKNGVSVSPSPMDLLCTSPTGLQCQMLRGSFSLCQIPTRESLMCGSELSVNLCEPVSFQSVELPTQEVWGCLYREIAPPTS